MNIIIIPVFLRYGTWRAEKLNNFLKITHVGSGEAEVWIQVVSLQNLSSTPLPDASPLWYLSQTNETEWLSEKVFTELLWKTVYCALIVL